MNDEFDDELAEEGWTDEDFHDEQTAVAECPNCGHEIFEDAVRCPGCGEYVTLESPAYGVTPLWYIGLALAAFVAVVIALSGLAALL